MAAAAAYHVIKGVNLMGKGALLSPCKGRQLIVALGVRFEK